MSWFAKKCIKIRLNVLRFLIDMLNDEIDEVRIGALKGISSFNEILQLNDNEVETVLFNLYEDNVKLRSEIYLFFGETIIDGNTLFLKLIDRLLLVLGKYLSEDQDHIYKLMRKLGQSHSEMVVNMYHRILDIDKRYLAKEPHWNDPGYIAKVILINSAASSLNPDVKTTEVLSSPPFFLEKHLNFFRDKYSQYFSNQDTE